MLKMKMGTINRHPNANTTTAPKTPRFVATISLPKHEATIKRREENHLQAPPSLHLQAPQ
jgi:hypothetical protein